MLRRVDVLKLFLVGGSSVLAQGIVTKGHPISGPYCLGIKPQLRKAKVDFELPVLDGGGKTMKFSDIPGKAVWLNFFASWCPSCNVEMPDILAMEAKYGQSGLTVIGVDVGETEQQARAFRDRHHVGFPICWTTTGRYSSACSTQTEYPRRSSIRAIEPYRVW